MLGLSKAKVVQMGQGLGVPWRHTFTCSAGVRSPDLAAAAARAAGGAAEFTRAAAADIEALLVHCGRCSQCLARQAAFHEAGVEAHDVRYMRNLAQASSDKP